MTHRELSHEFSPNGGIEAGEVENSEFLTRQLITYIGNKRALVAPIEKAIRHVRERMGGRRLVSVDLFSGTGFVSRVLKQHSHVVIANDLEDYSSAVNRCFLTNRSLVDPHSLQWVVDELNALADSGASHDGFVSELYAPKDDTNIQRGERAFYTNDNARRLDFFSQEIRKLPELSYHLLLGPLLSSASIHANTSGVFKGFYKEKSTGLGKFGGTAGDALARILAPIHLAVPVVSRWESECRVEQRDANQLIATLPEHDLLYVDPPYNQHPYGSNYFMLNLLTNYERPKSFSNVSGIPVDWNRSEYNVRSKSFSLLSHVVASAAAKFILVSFNSEGFVSTEEIRGELERYGNVDEIVIPYNTFRGSRNLRERPTYVSEHLFLLEKG